MDRTTKILLSISIIFLVLFTVLFILLLVIGPKNQALNFSQSSFSLSSSSAVVSSSVAPPNICNSIGTQNFVYRVAGTNVQGFSGDNGPAINAQLNQPSGIALNENTCQLYISDTTNQRIRVINLQSGIITTVVGTGVAGNTIGMDGLTTQINNPTDITVRSNGDVLIADTSNNRILNFSPITNVVSIFAGTGTAGFLGDGGLAVNARLNQPTGVVEGFGGNVYISDTSNNRIRVVNGSTGIITTIAGIGTAGPYNPAVTAPLNATITPRQIRIDQFGNIVFVTNLRVVYINLIGNPTIAFWSVNNLDLTLGFNSMPISIDPLTGDLYLIGSNTNDGWIIFGRNSTALGSFIGTGVPGNSGDNGPALSAQVNISNSLVFDSRGTLYMVSPVGSSVRRYFTQEQSP